MNLMEKAGRELVHVCTSTGRVFAFVGVSLFAVAGFAAESISITATPRYPWNGKVDLKFTIDGTSGTKYDTSFTAKDVAGGTNLTMKTLYKSDGTAANVAKEQLLPGTYNWVWDATADLTSRWPTYASCVPTSSTVLFKDTQLAAIAEFYAVPCGTAVSDKSNHAKGRWIKADGAGKSVQFAFSDDKYTKCVCVHFEQSGADVVGYVMWARYVDGLGHESEDFDENSATTQTIATSETAKGYGLYKMEVRVPQSDASVVLDRVVVEGEVKTPVYYVKFNANGGSGTMANEEFEVGVAKALTANAFKRTGYTFQGWATSTDGEVEYSDKQSVVNLTTSGSTVNLFAIWKGIVPVVNGLIAYWPFNGDINDYSGNSHHLSGTVSYGNDRNGVSKSAATFTGSAFLTQKTDLGVTGSMTFSCWVGSPTYTVSRDDIEMYLAAVGRGNFGQHWVYWPLIVFPASVTDGRGVGFSVAANRINVFANGEWFNVILDYSCDISSGWHHVAVTIGTSNSPVLYLDGVKVKEGSSAWNGFVPKLSNANTIGGGDYRAGGKYKGQLDDLCIYNRILSANEIKALHDAR